LSFACAPDREAITSCSEVRIARAEATAVNMAKGVAQPMPFANQTWGHCGNIRITSPCLHIEKAGPTKGAGLDES
jgi:hypothetical protein